MSSRRSARLKDQDLIVVEVQPITSAEAPSKNKKGKSQAKDSTGPKKNATASSSGKNKLSSQPSTGNDALSSLSIEILYMVLDNVSKCPSIILLY
jgi:hypothetical protein